MLSPPVPQRCPMPQRPSWGRETHMRESKFGSQGRAWPTDRATAKKNKRGSAMSYPQPCTHCVPESCMPAVGPGLAPRRPLYGRSMYPLAHSAARCAWPSCKPCRSGAGVTAPPAASTAIHHIHRIPNLPTSSPLHHSMSPPNGDSGFTMHLHCAQAST